MSSCIKSSLVVLLFCCTLFCCTVAFAQPSAPGGSTAAAPPRTSASPDPSTWLIRADSIDPSNYYGVTVANGMIGLVSSTDPFKAKDVVLNGAFDLYGRGRVSNILKTFNFVNLYLDIDDRRIESFKQT